MSKIKVPAFFMNFDFFLIEDNVV